MTAINVRNPLAVLTMFVVLIEGIAALVLRQPTGTLSYPERQLLLSFIVVFPFAVLLTFFRLVTTHHSKLYAPTDFSQDDGFFRAMSASERRAQLTRKVAALEAADEDKVMYWLGEPEDSAMTVRRQCFLASELALRQLEEKFGAPIQRTVVTTSGITLDGVMIEGPRYVGIEIRFVQNVAWENWIRGTVARWEERIVSIGGTREELMLVIVHQGLTQSQAEGAAREAQFAIGKFGHRIAFEHFDYSDLEERNGLRPSRTD